MRFSSRSARRELRQTTERLAAAGAVVNNQGQALIDLRAQVAEMEKQLANLSRRESENYTKTTNTEDLAMGFIRLTWWGRVRWAVLGRFDAAQYLCAPAGGWVKAPETLGSAGFKEEPVGAVMKSPCMVCAGKGYRVTMIDQLGTEAPTEQHENCPRCDGTGWEK